MKNQFRNDHFSLRHRVVARFSQLLDNVVYTQRRGLAKGLKRKGGLGFVPSLSSSTDCETEFFQRLDLQDKVVFDLGAFEGLTTLYFSQRAKHVVTYEPHPTSHARVRENLDLNNIRNVTLRNLAVGNTPGKATLTIDPLMPGAASANPNISDMIATSGNSTTVDIEVVRIDDDIRAAELPEPNFVKMDIEGFELQALQGLKDALARCHPDIYLEMHGATKEDKERNVAAIVQFLDEHGYKDIVHCESGSEVNPGNYRMAARGHLYCQFTG